MVVDQPKMTKSAETMKKLIYLIIYFLLSIVFFILSIFERILRPISNKIRKKKNPADNEFH